MEGPTPVSALIHAATMVTAGVYLVARTHTLFLAQPDSLTVVAIVSGASAFFAATIACVQTDIKRILAYSTMSQLAYMFMGEAAGGFSAGIFHLVMHAFFKALLFMGAGAVIHALGGEQDIRKMGGLRQRLSSVFWLFVVAGLALAAIFPFDGFWSKDSILGAILAARHFDWRGGLVRPLRGRPGDGDPDRLLHLPADLRHLLRGLSRRAAGRGTWASRDRWRAAGRPTCARRGDDVADVRAGRAFDCRLGD